LVKQGSTIVLVHLGKLPVFDGLVLLASRAADLSSRDEYMYSSRKQLHHPRASFARRLVGNE
jgi:hypothetical protein